MSTLKQPPKRTRSKLVVVPTSQTKLYNMTDLALSMDVSTRMIRRIREMKKSPFIGEFSRPEWVLNFLEKVMQRDDCDLKNLKITG